MGEGAWRSAQTWPPEGTRSSSLHLSAGRRLRDRQDETGDSDIHEVDLGSRSGRRSRWRTLISPFVHADGEGRSRSGLLVYDGEVLERDLEVAGNPILVLRLKSSAPDCAVLAYLEDVDAGSHARLVSEGELRTIHATRLVEAPVARVEASFRRADALRLEPHQPATHVIELLPLAMVFRRGHRIRLSLAGADVDHFTAPPHDAGTRMIWHVERAGSRLLLPTRSR
jgi:putative CocE/NonD family hydrolase